jgi:hypothetical protein
MKAEGGLFLFMCAISLSMILFPLVSNAGTVPKIFVPKISVSPTPINFGSLKVGEVSTKTLTITNTGNADLVIDSITIKGINPSEFGFSPANGCPNPISMNASCQLTMTFTPVSPFVKKSATLSISSNDLKKPTINVKLLGQAAAPKISVTPKAIKFATVEVGDASAPQTITVKNTGISDLTINSIAVKGSNLGDFRETDDCTAVSQDNLCKIDVILDPTSAGSKSAIMSISSDDPKKPIINVKLSGTGSHSPAYISGISVEAALQVLGPTGESINEYGDVLSAGPDKSETIFPPGTFKTHPKDTLFFFPPGGLAVLTDNGKGPNSDGVWILDFAPDYGLYFDEKGQPYHAQVFLAPYEHLGCPLPPAPPDSTFELNYAMPGTILQDPVNPGSLFMIYGGTNNCIGIYEGRPTLQTPFYATIGVATAGDSEGHTWPMYSKNSVPLPGRQVTPNPGPNSREGAIGAEACLGPDCTTGTTALPASFGRYAVSSVPFTLEDATVGTSPPLLPTEIGNAQPSSLIDTVHTAQGTYVYTVEEVFCPESCPNDGRCALYCVPYFKAPNDVHVISMIRAKLEPGGPPKNFEKWYGGPTNVNFANYQSGTIVASFGNTGSSTGNGLGAAQSPIFPRDVVNGKDSPGYVSCQARGQKQATPTLSYVETTNEYLLVFVCHSPTKPSDPESTDPENTCGDAGGATWMYSTLDASAFDLSRQDKWSTPKEIQGAWHCFEPHENCGEGIYDGWYPTLMTVSRASGHLSTKNSSFAFSMKGCTNAGAKRNYESRRLTFSVLKR